MELIKGVARGLAYTHRKNLVHRDIKPANILLAPADTDSPETRTLNPETSLHTPKIVDFGLARAGTDSELSVSGYGMGTPWYMPPEQRRNAKGVNHTADIYAVGKTLYELLTGQPPDNIDPEAVPSSLARVILKCCKTNPEERYFSCEELLTALEGESSNARKSGDRGVAQEGNICPSCNAANLPDVKFCVRCGGGLTRCCPECQRENSIHQQYCGGCGTEVEGFGKVQEALARMERAVTAKHWSRVLKEASLLAEKPVRLPAKQGQALLAKVEEFRQTAENVPAEYERLRQMAEQQVTQGDFDAAVATVQKLRQLDPHNITLLPWQKQVESAQTLVVRAQQELEAGHLETAQCIRNELLAIPEIRQGSQVVATRLDKVIATYRANLALYQQAMNRARIAMAGKRFADALAAANEALDLAPRDEAAEKLQGENEAILRRMQDALIRAAKFRHTDNQAALAACQEVLEKDDRHAGALQLMACIEGDMQEAAELRRAVREALAANKPDEALALWHKAVSLDGSPTKDDTGKRALATMERVTALLQEARLAMTHRQVDEAERLAQEVCEHQSDCSEAQEILAWCASIRGQCRKRRRMALVAIIVAALGVALSLIIHAKAEERARQNRIVAINLEVEHRQERVAAALAASSAAKASAQWQVCLDQAIAALSITPGQTDAMALKEEAEENLAPKLTVTATAGGTTVPATLSDGARRYTTPATLKLEPAQAYNFIVTYGGSADPTLHRRYKPTAITITANWHGFRTQTVALEEQKELAEGQAWTIDDLTMTFQPVAAGEFQMGSYSGGKDEMPKHRVKFSRTFWMGITEVTQKQWQALMGDNPSNFKGDALPVESVDWNKCVAFCQKLTQRERAAGNIPAGYEFRLPTEAEWEYAARGGTRRRGLIYSGSDTLKEVAWYSENSGSKTHTVGQKQANELGLYDMSGNAWEWCLDWYGTYESGDVTEPKGASTGSDRVSRGGSWLIEASLCRSSLRIGFGPSLVSNDLGFRVVLAPIP
ncbi:MAG: SUMF1/EgtB/PvdO family nonheme iron enzyme [Kiritimatiellia bacterium]